MSRSTKTCDSFLPVQRFGYFAQRCPIVWQFVSHNGFPQKNDSFSGQPEKISVETSQLKYSLLRFTCVWTILAKNAQAASLISDEAVVAEAPFFATLSANTVCSVRIGAG